jgi:integrase
MARTYGEGYLRKHGGHWQAVVRYAEPGGGGQRSKLLLAECDDSPLGRAGKGGRRPVPTGKGAVLAQEELAEWQAELEEESRAQAAREAEEEGRRAAAAARDDNDPAFLTVPEYVRNYVKARERDGYVGRSSMPTYNTAIKHIDEGFHDVMATDLTARMVERWKADMAADGLGLATVSKAFILLKSCMTHATDIGSVQRNPFSGVDNPRRKEPDPNALDPATVAELNTKLDNMSNAELALGVRIALNTGMREGEVCGLRWQDVDLAARVIHVRNNIARSGAELYEKAPKTSAGRRDIPISSDLLAALRARRADVERARSAMREPFDEGLFVIGDAGGGYHKPQMLYKGWKTLADAEGYRGSKGRVPTFHDLRHTFATIAIASGVDVKSVAAILGHANEMVTLRVYADSLPEAKRAGIDKMEGMLCARKEEKPGPGSEPVARRRARPAPSETPRERPRFVAV